MVHRSDDAGTSPVIAVILMVAITVVLAATVYVWVGSFGGKEQQPTRALSLSSNAPLTANVKSFTVSTAASGLRWSDLTLTLDGSTLAMAATAGCPAPTSGQFLACAGTTTKTGTSLVNGGDELKLYASVGQQLRVLDTQANSIILTVHIG